MTDALPAFYIPHGGGPCFFMEWDPPGVWDGMERFLRGLAASAPTKPKAIIVISAHWEAPGFAFTRHRTPPLLYDYYGFPDSTYALKYPAPGAPELAEKAANLLREAGLEATTDNARGFDHGVFIPFLLIYPNADIPIIQMSLKKGLDAATHIQAGEALAPLRKQGVMLVGSGMSYHNLRQFGPQGADAAEGFDRWLSQALTEEADDRNEDLINWQAAPYARTAHPREEHLLPLMVIVGAAGDDVSQQVYSDLVMGMRISAWRFG